MKRPKICASIVENNRAAIRDAEPLVDLFEVRIDLIGESWPEIVREIDKPWLACNRLTAEGGQWRGSEAARIEELLKAAALGADTVDIELSTPNLAEVVPLIKQKARCLVSHHDLTGTPPLDNLEALLKKQLAAGADICKLIATANSFEDNRNALHLITMFPEAKIVSFTMGPLGAVSRVLCPLVGGYFTYASIETGKEAAAGQMTARELRQIYEMVQP